MELKRQRNLVFQTVIWSFTVPGTVVARLWTIIDVLRKGRNSNYPAVCKT